MASHQSVEHTVDCSRDLIADLVIAFLCLQMQIDSNGFETDSSKWLPGHLSEKKLIEDPSRWELPDSFGHQTLESYLSQ